jgi:hypothetical protein
MRKYTFGASSGHVRRQTPPATALAAMSLTEQRHAAAGFTPAAKP